MVRCCDILTQGIKDCFGGSLAEPLNPTFLNLLMTALPESAVLRSPDERRPYECDGLSGYRRLPGVVVLPDTLEQVRSVMALCQTHSVPVVARGAGTGLSGGATPHPEGVLLSMARFNQILSVDRLACTARVQPGVRNLAISEAVAKDLLSGAMERRVVAIFEPELNA